MLAGPIIPFTLSKAESGSSMLSFHSFEVKVNVAE